MKILTYVSFFAEVKEDLSNAAKTFLDQIIEVGNNLREQVKSLEKTKQ